MGVTGFFVGIFVDGLDVGCFVVGLAVDGWAVGDFVVGREEGEDVVVATMMDTSSTLMENEVGSAVATAVAVEATTASSMAGGAVVVVVAFATAVAFSNSSSTSGSTMRKLLVTFSHNIRWWLVDSLMTAL